MTVRTLTLNAWNLARAQSELQFARYVQASERLDDVKWTYARIHRRLPANDPPGPRLAREFADISAKVYAARADADRCFLAWEAALARTERIRARWHALYASPPASGPN